MYGADVLSKKYKFNVIFCIANNFLEQKLTHGNFWTWMWIFLLLLFVVFQTAARAQEEGFVYNQDPNIGNNNYVDCMFLATN